MSAAHAPGGDSHHDVSRQGEGTAGVSLASVLAADVEDASAQHVVGHIRPGAVAGLGLQVGVALDAQLLVHGEHFHALEDGGGWAARLETKCIEVI